MRHVDNDLEAQEPPVHCQLHAFAACFSQILRKSVSSKHSTPAKVLPPNEDCLTYQSQQDPANYLPQFPLLQSAECQYQKVSS
ncbi:hypothetical protein BDY21DRAFT_347814 [Lineolata rhizophorae]|uniref:Uncharacterized protein n=1 Tax=Lineolata rhizophorae TaxID=578093 RepID=A0A6A6NWI7_9PEZI|nr:hypothetical protein BDY21DRAFT_347814 [Lineolata rhizophorae]